MIFLAGLSCVFCLRYLVNLTTLLEIPTAGQSYLGIRTLLLLFSKCPYVQWVSPTSLSRLCTDLPFKRNGWENRIFCLKMCHFQNGNDRGCEPGLFVRTFQSAVPDQSWSLTSAISVNSCPSVASRLFRTIAASSKNRLAGRQGCTTNGIA